MVGWRAGVGIAAGLGLFAALLVAGRPDAAYAGLVLAWASYCFGSDLSLNWQILIGTIAGISSGFLFGDAATAMGLVGRVFILLLKMMIAPMILLSITHGISSMSGGRALGRLGARTVGLYVLTMAFAVATGLLLVNLVMPGAGSDLVESEFFQRAVEGRAAEPVALGPSLLAMLQQTLTNPFASLAEGRILAIVCFAILFGVALLQVGAPARPLVEALGSAYVAVMKIIGWLIRLAPIGILALLGDMVATLRADQARLSMLVGQLAMFSGVVIGGTLFHAAVTLPLVGRVFGGRSPRELFLGIREALAVAFTTSSSAATLPVTMRCVEDNLGVPPRVSSFVLPLGATVNMDGTALYEAIAAVFVANLYGIELSISAQLVIFIIAMATAIGAPGIPSAGMVTMVVVLEAVGLPVEAVGLLITIDRFLDTFRTMANVEGDAVVAVCAARLEAGEPPD